MNNSLHATISKTLSVPPLSGKCFSRTLPLVFHDAHMGRPESILDTGPICGENVRFIADRVEKLYVRDLFRLLKHYRGQRQKQPFQRLSGYLDLPRESMDCILLWDLCDYLGDSEIRQLVSVLYHLVKPSGKLALFSVPAPDKMDKVAQFSVKENYEIIIRFFPDTGLPVFPRQNRNIMSVLYPFEVERSFMNRSGFREFLCVKR